MSAGSNDGQDCPSYDRAQGFIFLFCSQGPWRLGHLFGVLQMAGVGPADCQKCRGIERKLGQNRFASK